MVLEHVTTLEGIQFVKAAGTRTAASITAHHLLFNRNALFSGGIRPHYYCLPVLKREKHRQALLAAATSGHPRFFLGTDSAPHTRAQKESACGCAGCYTAHAAIEFYAGIFDSQRALDKLEAFASQHFADFYGLARNTSSITLQRKNWIVPGSYELPEGEQLIPLQAGKSLSWRLQQAL